MSHCEHCQFFDILMVQGPPPGDRLLGYCRRFPPPFGQSKPLKSEPQLSQPSHFPIVRGNDWCGEFQRSTTSMRRLSAPASSKQAADDMRLVVSAREAANMLGISERHLYALSAKGDLPRVRIGARVCYRIETLREWLVAHEARDHEGDMTEF